MDTEQVVVECRDCGLQEAFAKLGAARLAVEEHESESGHSIDWQIDHLNAGVERAGADAGVCGDPGCTNPESPLLDWQPTDRES